jgi:hypothetical protein
MTTTKVEQKTLNPSGRGGLPELCCLLYSLGTGLWVQEWCDEDLEEMLSHRE